LAIAFILKGSAQVLGGGTEASYEIRMVAYDADTDVFTSEHITTFGGRTTTRIKTQSRGSMITEEVAADIVANCAEEGDKIEQVRVKAGSFRACLNGEDTPVELWIAPVPFGIVKMAYETRDHQWVTFELSSFTRGD
jgi:hypothetical protein